MIITKSLTKKFGSLTAVDNVSIQVRRGEIYGLVGPDGAGKTTLIRMLCGIMDPTSGTVQLFRKAGRDLEVARSSLGYMPQRFSLYGDLTVIENINFFGRLYNLSSKTIKQRADELLEIANLTAFRSRFADNLSGGMKQKLSLTCSLLAQPDLLILDEPTFGVDPEYRKEFWKILYRLNLEGITILVSTAYMDEAELCTKVAFVNSGKLVKVDSPVNLKRDFPFKILELIIGTKDIDFPSSLTEVLDADVFGDRYHIRVADASAGKAAVQHFLAEHNIQVLSLREIPASIEDIFVTIAEQEAV
ncbi:MAG: ABC transporter ATP-binding protein [Desulfocucumaceae bacterium]